MNEGLDICKIMLGNIKVTSSRSQIYKEENHIHKTHHIPHDKALQRLLPYSAALSSSLKLPMRYCNVL